MPPLEGPRRRSTAAPAAEVWRLNRALLAENRDLQEQLDRLQHLSSVGQLTATVAHDFNNLIGVMLNYASFAREALRSGRGESAEQRWRSVDEDLSQIETAAVKASVLTRQLLAFARHDCAKPKALDVNALVGAFEEFLRRALPGNVDLVTACDDSVCPVSIDGGKLEQVLLNLAINARDAMPGGGTIVLRTMLCDIGAGQAAGIHGIEPGRYIRLVVEDTGTGMRKEVADHAFEPFFSTKQGVGGTGLGLSAVQRIVEQAGGHVSLDTMAGAGTTVTILLPEASALRSRPVPRPA